MAESNVDAVALSNLRGVWSSTGDIEAVLQAAIDVAEDYIAKRECFSAVQCCACYAELSDCWASFIANIGDTEFSEIMASVDSRSVFWAYLDLYATTPEGRRKAQHYSIRSVHESKSVSLDLPATIKMLCHAFDDLSATISETHAVPESSVSMYASRATATLITSKLCMPVAQALLAQRAVRLDTEEVHIYVFGLYLRIYAALHEARGAFSVGTEKDLVEGYTIGVADCSDRMRRMLAYMLKARLFITAVQIAFNGAE